MRSTGSSRIKILTFAAAFLLARSASGLEVKNLALSALGARAFLGTRCSGNSRARASKGQRWQSEKLLDGAPGESSCGLGDRVAAAPEISSVVVRYFDGRMVRGPAIARTQEWAFLQYWDGQDWKDLDAQLFGQETSTVRYSYIFDPVTTTRVRLSFTEPPDPEFRRTPDRLGIYVSEFEVYCDAPFQRVTPPQRLVPLSRDAPAYFNEPANGDARFDLAHPLIIEPKRTRIFEDTLMPTLVVSESRCAREPVAAWEPRPGQVQLQNGFLNLALSTQGGLQEIGLVNRVTGESVATSRSRAFLLRTQRANLRPTASPGSR